MPREDPYFKKCCYILPLSLCLQTWALIKMLAAFAALMISLLLLFYIVLLGGNNNSVNLIFMVLLVIMAMTLIVEIGFDIVLMVAVCKKDIKLMKIFYYYDIYVIIAETALLIGFIVIVYPDALHSLSAVIAICGVLFIALDICTLLAIKSELIKLRNKEQYDFTRIPKYPSEIEDISVKFTADDNLQ